MFRGREDTQKLFPTPATLLYLNHTDEVPLREWPIQKTQLLDTLTPLLVPDSEELV